MRQQIEAHYPQARVPRGAGGGGPSAPCGEGEQAWGMTLRSGGPEYAPLRVFRDDDLLDPGSDPLVALLGALSALREGERVVARLLLRSLGPDWSEGPPRKGDAAAGLRAPALRRRGTRQEPHRRT